MSTMAISQDDIDRLNQRLAGFEQELSEQERALLALVFGLAGDAIRRTAAGDPVTPLLRRVSDQATPIVIEAGAAPSHIRHEFERAFTPGKLEAEFEHLSHSVANIIGNR